MGTKRYYMKKGAIIIVLLLTLLGIGIDYTNTVEETMDKANISVKQILHKVTIDKGILVFYESINYPDSYNVGLVEKSFLRYKWVCGVGVYDLNTEPDLRYGYSNLGKFEQNKSFYDFPILHGVINNTKIEKVKVRLKDVQLKDATIIETQLGRLWYLFLDKEMDYRPKVIGMDTNGKSIYEKLIY